MLSTYIYLFIIASAGALVEFFLVLFFLFFDDLWSFFLIYEIFDVGFMIDIALGLWVGKASWGETYTFRLLFFSVDLLGFFPRGISVF